MRADRQSQAKRAALIALLALPGSLPAAASEPMSQPPTVRVAGIVLKWVRGDKEANYRRAEPLIREAAAHGARLVCTTECFLDGYAIADKTIPLEQYRALGEPIPDGKYFGKLCALARELSIHLVAGMLEADGLDRFNTAVVIGPQGELLGRYHKQHLEHEAVRNTAGRESSVVETPLGKIGVMICADRRLPEVVKGFCERGAEFLLCPSGGMYGPRNNDPILQARAKENRRFIVFVHPAEFLVTGPEGSILAQTVLGDRLVISPDQAGGEADSKRVFYFDVPRKAEGNPVARPTPAGNRALEPMNYQGVTLDAGPLRRQLDEVRETYLRIPNDDLLKGFRQRAGLPAPGADLGGWYSGDVFHVFGQIVSGLARLYAATGDPACRDKASTLITEWGRCIAPDGYFFYSAKPNARHYVYDKMLWGLLDAHLYAGNLEALAHLSRITDWAIQNLERSRKLGDTSTEWYTLSENLYRAWLATGDPKYRDFAKVWEYADYWGMYERGQDIFAPQPDGQRTGAYHAYSHVNTLGGAGAAFLATGEPRYLLILRNAYDLLQANQVFATGGYGPDEQLLPRNELLARLETTANTFETQCGSWAAFKLCKHLLTFTGDARYGGWIEQLVWNGVGASIPSAPDGRVFYYSDYNPHGGAKRLHETGWTCCTGTRPQAVADYVDLVYFHNATNLHVNLYVAATARLDLGGVSVTVRQTTRFPEEDTATFALSLARPARFAFRFRVPAWLARPMKITVNGEVVPAPVDDRHWSVVEREWKDGDRVHVLLPMALGSHALDPNRGYPAALAYGPVVLAFRARDAKFVAPLDLMSPEAQLTACVGEALTWRLAAAPEVLARPLFAYAEGQPYFLYLDPRAARRIPHRHVKFTGRWNDAGRFRFSNEIGATAECAFEGTGVRWLGYRFDDAGRAEVQIDGKVVGVVDQYGPGRDLPFDWAQRGLPPGTHTLHLRLLPEKSEASRDRFLNVAGFEPTDGTPE